MIPVCFPAHKSLSDKGSTLKGKNLLPRGAKSFLLEQSLFLEGRQEYLQVLLLLNVYQFPLIYINCCVYSTV